MAGNLAGSIAVLPGSGLQDIPRSPWHSFGLRVCSCHFLVFMPKLIQQGMNADTDAVIDVFGKNEQVRKVFWTLFIMMAGLVQARLWTRGYPCHQVAGRAMDEYYS